MLRQDDLDIAVGRGVITPEQSDALIAIAAERHRARAFAVGREERFRVLGGFNDFFIAVGVVLLGLGLLYAPSALLPTSVSQGAAYIGAGCVGAVGMWALSEWLTRRLRLTAPSIVAAVFWVVAAVVVTVGLLKTLGVQPSNSGATMLIASGALAAAVVYYHRFRLPFMLVLVPVAALVVLWSSAGRVGDAVHSVAAFLVGAVTFVAAMRYDLSDPERLTRAADCGFWLHLAAAPMIVHPVIGTLNGHLFFGTLTHTYSASRSVSLVIVATLLLALVALAIDRRALLVAGLGYLGAAISYIITQTGASAGLASIATLLFLGGTIIVLGTGWRSIRAALMSALPDFPLKNRFPPYIGS